MNLALKVYKTCEKHTENVNKIHTYHACALMQSQGMTSKVVVKVLKRQVLRAEGNKIKDALNMTIQVLEESRRIWDV